MKKFLSIILAILMIVTTMPFAFAADSDGVKTVLDVSNGFINISDSGVTQDYRDKTDPDGYIITGVWPGGYGDPINIINNSGEEKIFDLVFRDLHINTENDICPVRIIDNSPITLNIHTEGENKLAANERPVFMGGGDWYFGEAITKININLTRAENSTIQFERYDGYEECKVFYEYDNDITFTVDGKMIGGDMHFHDCADGKQTCEGYYCIVCERYYGEKDENAHESSREPGCRGYRCDICWHYFGEPGDHLKSYQTCIGWFCNDCQEINYPDEGDENKHSWIYGVCSYCNAAFPEDEECIHEWDSMTQCRNCGLKCEHQFVENNICSVCNSEMNFTVTTGDKVTYHKYFRSALDQAEDSSEITLINDCYMDDNYEVSIEKDVIIDINGHVWNPYYGLNLYIYADVKILGSTGKGNFYPSLRVHSPCTLYDGYYSSIIIENPEIEINDLITECCEISAEYAENGFYSDVQIKGNHDMVVDEAVAPDCTNTGLTEGKHCTKCDYKSAQKTVAALNHKDTLIKVAAKEKTCKENGWEAYEYCTACDYTTYKEIPASHEIIKVDGKDATCTQAGYEAYEYCTACDHTTYKEIPAAHKIIKVDSKDATCTQAGHEAYEYCTACTYTTYVEIPANGHSALDAVKENEVAPDCTKEGSYDLVVYCACGEELSRETVSVDALSHIDADNDGVCDVGGEAIACPDCGRPVHEGEINEYICILISFIRLITSLIRTIRSVA